ncbi:MAG: bifunctional diaminohydroxyphosphoribosylaminopyrimidine deaminase/5-amino-6-(5-phosphoribosylamino)uracil reductase RibD [Cyclobacteriaceae bacterium]|nr:bifunctional diaminohydroxyphosphoribosylaminopyrimidine deaminase/5-amino-6-(5-phosphoribosylamino)uracil reductase RibD [Cyclobacteriaceae bacterium]MDW8331974.1 bifunctional diaminohydroxyphosphoribosylaminopyrimidine deaminase/5-amino-6-(5-phosphoribosylamino)uracil reductase RibD [Cyclobacteriaceae bacterium]
MRPDHIRDELFMRRAMELALLGRGYVSPNPMVGCVVVHHDRIIGEGWHVKYGAAHAEVNALNAVGDKSLLKESTVYVNLEPCSHYGKTPPCANLLIQYGVQRVVISNVDPNPLVDGGGIRKLREAGIEVTTGVLEKEGHELNKRFFTFIQHKRPYIILKWAQTADGFVAKENFSSKWISNGYSRRLVHKWRSEEDAVLAGTRTVFHDNPQLNVRDWSGRNPVRVVIDRFLKLSDKLNVFDGTQPTLVYNILKHEELPNLMLIRLDEEDFLQQLVHDLYKRNIQSVVVEGGAFTLQSFIDAGLWDEARVFIGSKTFGKGIAAPNLGGVLVLSEHIADDLFQVYKNEKLNNRS